MKKVKLIVIASLAVLIMGAACFAIAVFGDTSEFNPNKTYFCPGVCIREQASE